MSKCNSHSLSSSFGAEFQDFVERKLKVAEVRPRVRHEIDESSKLKDTKNLDGNVVGS